MNPVNRWAGLALVGVLVLPHTAAARPTVHAGAEGFDLSAKPHAGTLRDAGSTPAASTRLQPVHAKPSNVGIPPVSRAYRTADEARALTIRIARELDTPGLQIRCLLNLWHRESRFRPDAYNRHSGAGGIPQILGMDPKTPTQIQIRKGFRYINARYGTPCGALRHHDRHGWY